MWTLLLLAASSPPTAPACVKLHMEYDRLETTWGYVVSLRKDMMGAAPSLEFRKELRKEGIAEDEVYAKKADRIVALLLANKCTPPDHVAAPKLPKEN